MGKMKGAGAPVSQFVQWAFLIIIGLFLIYILVQWVSASELTLANIEESTLVYTLSSSINAFSVAEKASLQIDWGVEFDVEIKCSDKCYISVTPYRGGNKGKPTDDFLIIGDIEPKSKKITKTGNICVEKGYEDPKDKVVIKRC